MRHILHHQRDFAAQVPALQRVQHARVSSPLTWCASGRVQGARVRAVPQEERDDLELIRDRPRRASRASGLNSQVQR